jgi:hypothetical protein
MRMNPPWPSGRRLRAVLGAAAGAALWVGGLAAAQAHEVWMSAAALHPPAGAEVAVEIGVGHQFPRSESALPDRRVGRCLARTAEGVVTSVETRIDGARRIGRAPAGAALLELHVLRPPLPRPDILARAWLRPPDAPAGAEAYATGEGLEIVPLQPPHAPEDPGRLPLALRRDGRPASGTLVIQPARGRVVRLRATPDQPAVLPLTPGMRYLIVTTEGGQTATAVFEANP